MTTTTLTAPPTELGEARPLSAAAAGPCDFDAVYEKHAAFVYRTVRRLGVAESAVADVTQDVFVVVHRRLADFERRSTLETWLYGIVVFVVRDYRRSRQREQRVLTTDELDDSKVASPASRPDDAAAVRDELRLLQRLLDGLDDDKREVFVLTEVAGLSMPEVAEILEVNVNTAYARLRAARLAFENALARARKQSGQERR